MEEKDGRVKLITEVLRGIKVIKLYVWEQHFVRAISSTFVFLFNSCSIRRTKSLLFFRIKRPGVEAFKGKEVSRRFMRLFLGHDPCVNIYSDVRNIRSNGE